jgi:hypothetical protein
MNTIENISIDRLHTIEKERETTMADTRFQQWCKDMRIGIMYSDRAGINRANDMMKQWHTDIQSGLPKWINKL